MPLFATKAVIAGGAESRYSQQRTWAENRGVLRDALTVDDLIGNGIYAASS
jgi:hypothetical protein